MQLGDRQLKERANEDVVQRPVVLVDRSAAKPVKTSRRGLRRRRWGFEQLEVRQLLASDMPNILVINTDDQRWDSLPFMPILQAQLAPNSTVFTNSFVTTPICAPSRASLFTGMYAFNHGVLHVDEPWGGFENFNDTSTLATWLDSAGYNTAHGWQVYQRL